MPHHGSSIPHRLLVRGFYVALPQRSVPACLGRLEAGASHRILVSYALRGSLDGVPTGPFRCAAAFLARGPCEALPLHFLLIFGPLLPKDFLSKFPYIFFARFVVFPYFPIFPPEIGMRSLPNILPSNKFPNLVNASCFPCVSCFSSNKKEENLLDKNGPLRRLFIDVALRLNVIKSSRVYSTRCHTTRLSWW